MTIVSQKLRRCCSSSNNCFCICW